MSEEKNIRVQLNAAQIRTSYANAFQTRHAAGEFIITFGVSHTEASSDPAFVGTLQVDMQEHVAMTPRSAKRLTTSLVQALRDYEEQFGLIDNNPL